MIYYFCVENSPDIEKYVTQTYKYVISNDHILFITTDKDSFIEFLVKNAPGTFYGYSEGDPVSLEDTIDVLISKHKDNFSGIT